MRRRAITALVAALAALSSGCASRTERVSAVRTADAPLWSAGAGDALGESSFHHPVIVAAHEAHRARLGAPDSEFAAAPSE